ncbi:ABC transporter [Agromyces sp. ISL-38]|uniref:ABC transporter n=1 Tax=Agromyces sp. ISL-38 TaxID=2819107 RepID=UPI001BEA2EE8|nr:ABC transporter [Agromyces sp. ISL-38]MBT2498633.1 ABC transporter [Agromyces sp. ISL-38]
MSSTTPGSEPGGTGDAERPVDDDTVADVEPVSDPGAPTAASVDSGDGPDATARLDAAVERAKAEAAASDSPDTDAYSEPVAADAVRREAYVPSATMAPGAAAGAATLAEEPAGPTVAPQPVAPQTIYVQAPTPPKRRGNRGFGALVALIGTVVFALVYAGVAYLLVTWYGAARGDGVQVFTEFLARPVFWVPVVAFFIGFALLAAIVNRGAWWYYAVFGLLVGVFVYFAYLGGSLLTVEAWTLTADEAGDFIAQRWLDPFAIAAFIIAREIPIWLGGWTAAHGRTVTERNRLAREAYDRELAAGPQAQRY